MNFKHQNKDKTKVENYSLNEIIFKHAYIRTQKQSQVALLALEK